MSLIRLQKYKTRAAASLLVWFLFCVGIVCTNFVPASLSGGSDDASTHASVLDTSHNQMQIPHTMDDDHESLSEHSCCGNQADDHEMSKIIGSNVQLVSALAALAFMALTIWLYVFLRGLVTCSRNHCSDPPTSGYPPLFLTTQRLLN